MKKLLNYTFLFLGILVVWAIILVASYNSKVTRDIKKSTVMQMQIPAYKTVTLIA